MTFTGVGKGVSPAGANNLRVIVGVDTGSGYVTVLDRGRTGDKEISDNRMFFVPGNIVGLQITLSPTVVGEVDVYDLRLIDPWEDY